MTYVNTTNTHAPYTLDKFTTRAQCGRACVHKYVCNTSREMFYYRTLKWNVKLATNIGYYYSRVLCNTPIMISKVIIFYFGIEDLLQTS